MSVVEGWSFFRGGPKNGRILQGDDEDYFPTGETIHTSAGHVPVLMARNDIRPIVMRCSSDDAAESGEYAEAEYAS